MSDDSESNVFNIFDLYAAKKAQNQNTAEKSAAKVIGGNQYYALGMEAEKEKQEHIRIHQANGIIRLMPYAAIRQVICVPLSWIMLHFEHFIVTLEGNNLVPIVRLVQDKKLSAIYAFKEGYHQEPAPDQPIVRVLQYQTLAQAIEEAQR